MGARKQHTLIDLFDRLVNISDIAFVSSVEFRPIGVNRFFIGECFKFAVNFV